MFLHLNPLRKGNKKIYPTVYCMRLHTPDCRLVVLINAYRKSSYQQRTIRLDARDLKIWKKLKSHNGFIRISKIWQHTYLAHLEAIWISFIMYNFLTQRFQHLFSFQRLSIKTRQDSLEFAQWSIEENSWISWKMTTPEIQHRK